MKITGKIYEVAKALEKALQLPEGINILNIGDKLIKYCTDDKDSVMVNTAENGVETVTNELVNQVRAELKLSPIVTPSAPVVKPKIDAPIETPATSTVNAEIANALHKELSALFTEKDNARFQAEWAARDLDEIENATQDSAAYSSELSFKLGDRMRDLEKAIQRLNNLDAAIAEYRIKAKKAGVIDERVPDVKADIESAKADCDAAHKMYLANLAKRPKAKMNVMELYALSCDKEKIMSAILKGAENATVDASDQADKITIGKLNVALLWINKETKDKDRCEMTKKVITKARQYLGLQAKNPVAIGDKPTSDISPEELDYLVNCRREYENTHESVDMPLVQVKGFDFLIDDTTAADAFTAIRYLTNDDTFRFEKINRFETLFINKARNLAIKVIAQEGNSFPLTRQDISAKRIARIELVKIEGDVFTALATFNIDRRKPRVFFDHESIHKMQKKIGLPIVDYKPVEYGAPIVLDEPKNGTPDIHKINDKLAAMDKKLFTGAFRIVFTLKDRKVIAQNVNGEPYLVDDSGNYLNVNGGTCFECREWLFEINNGILTLEGVDIPKMKKSKLTDEMTKTGGSSAFYKTTDKVIKVELIPVLNAEIETVKYDDYSAEIEKMRAAYAVDDLKKRSAVLAHIWQRDIAKKAGFGNNAKAGEVKAHFGINKGATIEEIISALSNSPSNAPVNEPQNATVATVDAEIANATAPSEVDAAEYAIAPAAFDAAVDAEIANATAPAVVLFIADVPQNPEYYGISTKITKKGNTSWFINGEYVREGDAKSKLKALIQAATNKTIEGKIRNLISYLNYSVESFAQEYKRNLKYIAQYSLALINSINSARYLANNPFDAEEVNNVRGIRDAWFDYNYALNELVYFVIEKKDAISRIAKMREQLDALISEYPQVAAVVNDIGDVDAAAAKFDALQEKINNLPAMLYDNFNLMLQLTNCTPAVDAPAEVPVNTPVILLPPPKSEPIDAAALETNALSKINAYVRDVNAANSRIAMHSRARVIDNAIAAVKAAALQIALKEARDLNLIIAGLNTLIVRIEEAAQQLDCDENAISYTLNRGYSLNTLENVNYRNSQSLYDATYSDFNDTAKSYDLLNIYDALRRASAIVSNNEIDAAITDFENFAPPSDLAIAEIANHYFEHAADNAPESPTTPANEPLDTNPSTDNEPPATSPTAPDSLIKQIGSNHAAAITAMLAANQTPVASLVNDYLAKVKFADSNGVGKKRNCNGFYSPSERTISLDINADAKKHYATFFHEVAHMIDDLNGSVRRDEFFTGFNQNLEAAAFDDCNAIAENPSLRGLLNSDINSLQSGCTRYALIDIIAMASDGKLMEYGKGHNRKYARHINSRRIHYNLVTEIFAELTAAAICEPHNLPIIHKYLPRTLDAYYKTVDAISANPEMNAVYTRLNNGLHCLFHRFTWARHSLNDAAHNLISLVNQFNQDFHAFTKFDWLADAWHDYTSAVNRLRNLADNCQSRIQFANRDIQFAQDFMAKFPQYHELYPDVYANIDSINKERRLFLDATDSAQINKLIADTWQFISEETFSAPVNALREYAFKIEVYQKLIEGGNIFNGDRFADGDKITISPKYKMPVMQIGDTPVGADERRLTIIRRRGLSLHVKTNKGRKFNIPTQIDESGAEYFYATVISGGNKNQITISPNSTLNIKIDADKNARYISLLEFYIKRCNANCGADIKLPSYCL